MGGWCLGRLVDHLIGGWDVWVVGWLQDWLVGGWVVWYVIHSVGLQVIPKPCCIRGKHIYIYACLI